MIEFQNSWALSLLLLPIFIWRYVPVYQTKQTALRVSFFDVLIDVLGMKAQEGATQLQPTLWQKGALVFGWCLLVLAMAKPVMLSDPQTREIKGRDLMVIVDLSGSMDQKDFIQTAESEPMTRIKAAQHVLSNFSQTREGDRLGLIVFGDAAYLQTPFTADLDAWRELLLQTRTAMAGQNTHLGDAIGLGIKHYTENGESEQKVMLVVTDGNDTDSLVPPVEAAKVAAQYGVRIHMIAIGDPVAVGEQQLDMETIKGVADITGGESFLALSPSELERVSQTISELEPALYKSYTYQVQTSLHYIPIFFLVLNHLIIMWSYSVKRYFMSQRLSPTTTARDLSSEVHNER
ncbi:VWA domain-containing protein [uncultured Vibrio sp.]|uniref:VWA domain-containing protein n=1 Tax=uncultured Vibrio sp. TaxID=114054 RepID=UPI0025FC33C6|nr:VWA domain-containing protein [uncultured Vibrio sp.]